MSVPHYDVDQGSVYCEDCDQGGTMPGYFAEADTPEHCEICEKLLDTRLTSEGLLYVEQAIQDYLRGGMGRGEIVLQWAERWLPEMVEDIKSKMANFPDKAGTPEDTASISTDGGKA